MPIIEKKTIPEKLKPYDCLGVNLIIPADTANTHAVTGDCPWCGKEGRFNVTLSEGLWRCVACNIGSPKGGGNVYTFIQTLHSLSMKATSDHEYKQLAQEFTLLFPDTLKAWGVCKSIIDQTWLAPGFSIQDGTNEGGKINTLYRYTYDPKAGKKRWFVTAGMKVGLSGPDLPTPTGGAQVSKREKNGPVYWCEGLKDGMALYEVALRTKLNDDGGLSPTSNSEASLLWAGSVVAVPGAGMFHPKWAAVSAGRPHYSLYHNDHPKENPPGTGRFTQASLDGSRKAAEAISHYATPPREMKYLRWGNETFHDPSLKSGYDVRDHLAGPNKTNTMLSRIKGLGQLLDRLQPIPADWIPGRDPEAIAIGGTSIRAEECRDFKTLMNAFRGAFKPTPGLERFLLASLASILSVPSAGDQLWIMGIGPPSCGKSTICEALSVNRTYVLPKDTMTGLFSGWTAGLKEGENLSLAGEMMNKTLVIKDADTILRNPQAVQIMSQFRALYDRAVRTQYKTKASKDWEGLNATVILAGTATLFEMDAAEKGARYLTVDIEPQVNHDLEWEIALRVGHRSFKDMTIHANGTAESRDSPEVLRFKKLTGGYISYLRENAVSLIEGVVDPDGKQIEQCAALATFISYMRCRPPKKQTEKVEREKPYRLTSQFVRLARGLAVVMNRKILDPEVMAHVKAIGLDTAQGKVLRLCDAIRAAGPAGTAHTLLAQSVGIPQEETLDLLRFLRRIQGVTVVNRSGGVVKTGRTMWTLSPILASIYNRVFGPPAATLGTGGDDD